MDLLFFVCLHKLGYRTYNIIEKKLEINGTSVSLFKISALCKSQDSGFFYRYRCINVECLMLLVHELIYVAAKIKLGREEIEAINCFVNADFLSYFLSIFILNLLILLSLFNPFFLSSY